MSEFRKADQIRLMIEKAHRSLRSAENLLQTEDYESCSSRAYYAVFHILQAALLTKDLVYSKHSGVISAFSEHFLKEGVFPRDFAKRIRKLRKDRETGDYSYTKLVEREDSQEDLTTANEIVQVVERYLRESQY